MGQAREGARSGLPVNPVVGKDRRTGPRGIVVARDSGIFSPLNRVAHPPTTDSSAILFTENVLGGNEPDESQDAWV